MLAPKRSIVLSFEPEVFVLRLDLAAGYPAAFVVVVESELGTIGIGLGLFAKSLTDTSVVNASGMALKRDRGICHLTSIT